MNTPNEQQLATALFLAKEKTKLANEMEKLQKSMAGIDAKISAALGGTLPVANPTATNPVKAEKPAPKAEPNPSTKMIAQPGEKPNVGAKRGQLGREILALLKIRPEGIKVDELARTLGREQSHLYVWRANIGKKIVGLNCTGGLFTYKEPEGGAADTEPATKSS